MFHHSLVVPTLLACLTLAGHGGTMPPGGQLDGREVPLVALVLGALDKTIFYYETNGSALTLDGAFGAKAIEGQLNLVVAKHNKGFVSAAIDTLMKDDLSKMAARAGRVVKLAIPNLYHKHPQNMLHLRRLLQLSWDIGHSHRSVDPKLVWTDSVLTTASNRPLSDEEGDRCVGELLEPVVGVVCGMSEGCQWKMTEAGRKGEALTRQILYTIVAEMSGCGSRLEQWLVSRGRSGSVEQLQAEMCSNLYTEARTIPMAAQEAQDPAPLWDKFLEMEFVCGMLGYVDFLREDWLRQVLAWQRPSGCFPATSAVAVTAAATPSRKLLLEQKLPDGCLSHLTGVAGSALAVHLHHLLYPGLPQAPLSPLAAPSPPSYRLQPPKYSYSLVPSLGLVINKPRLMGTIHSGWNRIADQEKSLEDKADLVMQRLEEQHSATGHNKPAPLPSITPLPRMPGRSAAHPLSPAQHLSPSTSKNVAPSEPSVAPLCLVVVSIALVVAVMARHVHARRRAHLVFKNKFRF